VSEESFRIWFATAFRTKPQACFCAFIFPSKQIFCYCGDSEKLEKEM